MSRGIVALILFLVLPNLNVFADTEPTVKQRIGASMRSGCILAGTGQFYNGETDRGVLYLFVECVSLGYILAAWEDNVSYSGGGADYDGDDGEGTVAFYIWAANRIISAVDAAVSGKKQDQQEAVSVSPIGNKGRRGIMMSLRF